MKNVIIIFLVLILISGCSATGLSNNNNVALYYYRAPDSKAQDVICAEYADIKTVGNDLDTIISAYFNGPQSEQLQLLFPAGTSMLQLQQEEEIATVILSRHCRDMSRLYLTLACACLAKTIEPFVSCQIIQFTTEDGFSNYDGPVQFSQGAIISKDSAS